MTEDNSQILGKEDFLAMAEGNLESLHEHLAEVRRREVGMLAWRTDLPPVAGEYLVTVQLQEQREVILADWTSGRWKIDPVAFLGWTITGWMPLPSPYQGDVEGVQVAILQLKKDRLEGAIADFQALQRESEATANGVEKAFLRSELEACREELCRIIDALKEWRDE